MEVKSFMTRTRLMLSWLAVSCVMPMGVPFFSNLLVA